mgnify:CR=1 FL=1
MAPAALSGYRVLDLSDQKGAYGGKLLADLGAEVIKIEAPAGDPVRLQPPFKDGLASRENSLYHAYMNANKQSVTLSLETADGRDLFRRMVGSADVVYECYPPGYLAERGIGYDDLRRVKPDIVWVAVTPYGQTGPRRDWAGSDLVGWAAGGVLNGVGDPDRAPAWPASVAQLGYLLAGVNAAAGVLLALRSRRVTGESQFVDISVQEAVAAITPEIGVPAFLDDLIPKERFGNRRRNVAPSGLYACKDGYVAVIIVSPAHWVALAQWIREKVGVEDVTHEVFETIQQRRETAELLEQWTEELTLQYTKQEFFVEGQRRGIAITPVNTVADLLQDPHLEARGYWTTVSHPILGEMRMPRHPYRLSQTPVTPGRAPLLGEHNRRMYMEELGLSQEMMDLLGANGVI